MTQPLVDIHCHLLPGLDDGAPDWETSLAMAQMAIDDGIRTIIATPHQLGNYAANRGETIREQIGQLRTRLAERGIPLRVLPGGDVRIEGDLSRELVSGNVVTLADHGRHVLLELPHELYFPLDPVLAELAKLNMVGVLSHPERNRGLLGGPELVLHLVDQGCLMQVTAGSLTGRFGPGSQQLSEWMLAAGSVHFVATDAHGLRSRRPKLSPAYQRVAELTDEDTAQALCITNPGRVAAGEDLRGGRRKVRRRRRWSGSWFARRTAA